MKYLPQIITFMLWPILIYVSYKVSFWAMRKYEEKNNTNLDTQENRK